MIRHLRLLGALTLLVSVAAGPARAQAPAAKQEAATRFERGIRLYEAGDYPASLAEFEAAYRAVPRFEVLYNIGLAQRKIFRYGEAVDTLERYLREGGARIPGPRRAAVQRELAELETLCARVTVRVEGAPAEIDVDGQPAGQTPLARPLLLGPGRHLLRARRPGEEPATEAVELVSGAHTEIVLAPRLRPNAPTTARLIVGSRPAGAEILIDGKLRGRAPWTAVLDPGGHELVATLAGYERARTEVVLSAGQERPLALELSPIPVATPWYKRWYVWTAVGAVVAGGVVAAVVATRTEPDVKLQYPP